jgi:hypothetical protein
MKKLRLIEPLVAILLLTTAMMTWGCSSESEYALLDSRGRDTGHRILMANKSEGPVSGRLIVQMDYRKDPTDYFAVPFNGKIKEESTGGGRLEAKSAQVRIKMHYGGYEDNTDLAASVTIRMRKGLPGRLTKHHPVYQIGMENRKKVKDFYHGYLGWGITKNNGSMSSPHEKSYLIPVKCLPAAICKTPDPTGDYAAYLKKHKQ